MNVLFYDKKNKRTVYNKDLMSINLVREVWVGNSQDHDDEDYLVKEVISSLGYKSIECPSVKNWDLHCNPEDLVFLRLEE